MWRACGDARIRLTLAPGDRSVVVAPPTRELEAATHTSRPFRFSGSVCPTARTSERATPGSPKSGTCPGKEHAPCDQPCRCSCGTPNPSRSGAAAPTNPSDASPLPGLQPRGAGAASSASRSRPRSPCSGVRCPRRSTPRWWWVPAWSPPAAVSSATCVRSWSRSRPGGRPTRSSRATNQVAAPVLLVPREAFRPARDHDVAVVDERAVPPLRKSA